MLQRIGFAEYFWMLLYFPLFFKEIHAKEPEQFVYVQTSLFLLGLIVYFQLESRELNSLL